MTFSATGNSSTTPSATGVFSTYAVDYPPVGALIGCPEGTVR